MDNSSTLVIQYQNQAIIEGQLQKAHRENTTLCIVKVNLEFDPKKGGFFKDMILTVYDFLDHSHFINVGKGEFFFFIQNSKIHTTVKILKNLLLSMRLKEQKGLNGIGVTSFEKNEDINDALKRAHELAYSSTLSNPKEVHYATSSFSYSQKNSQNGLKSIFVKEPRVLAYGFYKEAPIMQKGEVLEYNENKFVLKLSREYLSFLKREPFIYIENSLVPDIMRADIISINHDDSTIQLSEVKFLEDSPVHRKNIRVTPHKPILSSFDFEELYHADAVISDISKNSILVTTQLQKVEELVAKDLKHKKFNLSFNIEDEDGTFESIRLNAMIFKITGNQIILNIYPDEKIENQINDYIIKCQKLLLLEAQGIRV
jgi:hypothetical protein